MSAGTVVCGLDLDDLAFSHSHKNMLCAVKTGTTFNSEQDIWAPIHHIAINKVRKLRMILARVERANYAKFTRAFTEKTMVWFITLDDDAQQRNATTHDDDVQ